jgi:ATP-binding cassette subfamily C protein
MAETRAPRKRVHAKRVHSPSLLQMEAVECGAASLGIVLAHFGKIVPLAELRRECGVSRDGSNAASVVKAARRYGLEAKGFSKGVDDLREVKPPFIIVGHRTVSIEEFEELFTGVTLIMTPGPDFEKGGRKPSVTRALTDRLRGFYGALLFAVLAGFLLVAPGLAIPAFAQVFLDEVLIHQREDWLRPLLMVMAVAIAAQGLLKYIQLRGLRRFRLSIATRMSAQFFWHLLKLPVDFYSQRFSGEISNRSRLNDKVAGVLSGQLAQTVIDVVMMVFYAALMFFYDEVLTAIGIFCAALNFAALRGLSRKRVEANMRLLQEYGKVSGASIAGLQSMETIKASGMESGFFHRWAGYYANASNARQEIELTNQALGVLPGLLSSLTTMLVLVIGGLHVIDGTLTIGGLVAFQILMSSFLRPVGNMVLLGRTIQELHGDMSRLDDVLSHEQDPGAEEHQAPDGATDGKLKLQGHVELRGITFGYSRTDAPLIEDFDLEIKPGQRVAFVGGSGSGKTTLAKLVTGLYQPWSGEILFDGVPRQQVPRTLMANSLSMVDQDLLLFGGPVRDNLTLWDETVPDQTLAQACDDAEIGERVRSLPGGFDGELSEGGSNLSGGERQRLEIARSLVNNPTILVLDEATSALDAESERVIAERIGLRGCSCILVAHRLSTIRDCDEIIVLDHGKVAERGTHDELWKLGGLYAGLLRSDEGSALEEAS